MAEPPPNTSKYNLSSSSARMGPPPPEPEPALGTNKNPLLVEDVSLGFQILNSFTVDLI